MDRPIGPWHGMLIGVLSDTHDQTARAKAAVSLLASRGAELLIHCGDLTSPGIVYECSLLPAYFVFGNCDHDHAVLREAIGHVGGHCLERGGEIALAGRRLCVTHGDSEAEVRRLLALEPDYLLTGHTHRQADVRRGRTRCINPGALHRASTWTVMLLNLACDHAEVLPILDERMQS